MSVEIAELCRQFDPERIVLTESETCKLQIQANSNAQMSFPIEILASRIENTG